VFEVPARRRACQRAADLDTATIRRFITWLAMPTNGRRRGVRSQSGQLGMIRPVLKRAIADNPGLFAPGFAVPNNAIPLAGVQRLPQDRLTPAAMRALLAVCYAEIDTAWAKFQHGQTIVNLPNVPLHVGGPPNGIAGSGSSIAAATASCRSTEAWTLTSPIGRGSPR
jgi:hypothetical protein